MSNHSAFRIRARALAWVLILPLLLFTACGSMEFNFRDNPEEPTRVEDVVEALRQTVQGWVDDAPQAIRDLADRIEAGVAELIASAGPLVRQVMDEVEFAIRRVMGEVIPATGDDGRLRPTLPAGGLNVQVHFVDIGQGDAVLVRSGQGQVALIDGGELDSGITDYLRSQQIERVDLLIATHPHSDHIGGLVEVLEGFPVSRVVTNGQPHTTQVYERFLDAVIASEAEYIEVKRGARLPFGDLVFEVLNPPATGGAIFAGDINENSLVLRLEVGQVAFLFTGDAEASAEADMLAANQPLQAEVLKLGHHGSSTSTHSQFLAEVSPSVAVYQAGAANSYGHPDSGVIRMLEAAQVQVYGTDQYGTIIITTDGISYQIEGVEEMEREVQP
jgi:beta-lactamase superfamily II metal-dependent hydrolase